MRVKVFLKISNFAFYSEASKAHEPREAWSISLIKLLDEFQVRWRDSISLCKGIRNFDVDVNKRNIKGTQGEGKRQASDVNKAGEITQIM